MQPAFFSRVIFVAAAAGLVSLAGSLLIPPAHGATSDYGLSDTGKKIGYVSPGGKSDDVYSLVNTTVSAGLGALGIVFFGLMTYAGIRWMTARGNEELVGKAKHTLEAAMIGLIIIVLSYALTAFILGKWPAR